MAAHFQSMYDQAAIACALERYRMGKGTYPNNLAEMSPAFMKQIPMDIVNGQPLHYRRQDQTFLLYSVGWEQKDEGGRQISTHDANGLDPHSKGNWTWMAEAR
jgi:hypothetical protein